VPSMMASRQSPRMSAASSSANMPEAQVPMAPKIRALAQLWGARKR
jgi:hypothetical protein